MSETQHDQLVTATKRAISNGHWFKAFTSDEQVGAAEINAFLDELTDTALRNTITYSCSNERCPLGGSSVVIVIPAPAPESIPEICEDCPPVGYPGDHTRCLPCPRRSPPAAERTQP